MELSNVITIPPQTPWLTDPSAQAVCRAIEAGGFTVYFVGGCVRNALLGIAGSDVDLCTNAPPETVMNLARAAGHKAIPTGIEHGTITVVSGGEGFEVTTFRRDVQTDGRRAVVAFSDCIQDDARRRDFTINALYVTPQGDVIDPLGGLADIRARRIRFIEDADQRIREDYLRILRFFRFHAYYADPALGFDADTLDAIARNAGGLTSLSAERVGSEITKLLKAPNPVPAIAVMRQIGVLAQILPGADDTMLGPVVHLADEMAGEPDWLVRLAVLGGDDAASRLRLPRADARVLGAIAQWAWSAMPLPEVAYRFGLRVARGAYVLRAVLANTPLDPVVLRAITLADEAKFPLGGRDLPEYTGKALGARLKSLEQVWIDSGFTLDQQVLLSFPPDSPPE